MTSTLIGRDHALTAVRAELNRTLTSHGGLVLVSGEAGIGKTTFAASVADEARHNNALVISGTAWDRDGAPGYWPWIQVVRDLQRSAEPDEWESASAAAGQALSYLVGAADGPPTSDITGDCTFWVHDSLTTLLVTASRNRPVIVVLDDLHWADAASIALLEFLAHHAWFERVLVVGTYRDVEVEAANHPLGSLLPAMATKATNLRLNGLDTDQVGTLLERTAGHEPESALAARVHRRTGGNPFFVEQLARLWQSGSPIDVTTPGICETIRTRLSHLPSAVVDVLTTAAVAGSEFDREVLVTAAETPSGQLDSSLDRAVTAGLLTRLDAGRFAFVHDLVRESLHADLDATALRARHAAITRGVERLGVADTRADPGFLAHHAYLAVPEVAAAQAREYLLVAGRNACCWLAAEEAARHFGRALELTGTELPEERAHIALDLGSTQHFAGHLTQARATFEEVVTTGRALGDARMLARAALGMHALGVMDPAQDGQRGIELVDEAHAGLVEQEVASNDPLLVRTLAAASRARSHLVPGDDRPAELSARAVHLARTCGDDETLAFSLLAQHDAIWEPGTAPERAELAAEMGRVARRVRDPELEPQASLLCTVALLEQGDPRGLDEHDAFLTIVERTRLPRNRYLALSRQAAIATFLGRFGEARAAIDDAFALGKRLGESDRERLWWEQRWALALMRGDWDDASWLVTEIPADNSHFVVVSEALLATQWGDAETARRYGPEVTELAGDFHGAFKPVFLRAQAQIAAVSADPRLCEDARAALAPFKNLWAVAGGGGAIYGPYAHWLALVDAAQQRWDAAIDGFTAARDAADLLRARPWSVEARLHLGRALLNRQGSGDTTIATDLLAGVEREASEIGMRETAERARRARPTTTETTGNGHAARDHATLTPSPTTAPGNVFRFDEQVWTLTFSGHTVHLPDAKGLRDLHSLLSRPGADVPAPELLNPQGGQVARVSREFGGDPMLDDQARAAYQRRLTQLDEEIEDAAARHDDNRAATLDQERAALLDELRSATGLAGRTRRLGDDAERARKTVYARVRDTLRRIDGHHPELAEHLRASVSTGVTCRYQPSRDTTWQL